MKLMLNTARLPAKKRSRKRKTVQISGWGSPELKATLAQVAASEGISFSQTVIAILKHGVAEKLHQKQEILAEPIVRKILREELRPLKNTLAEFHGRELFETGQIRWLLVNRLFRQVLNTNGKLTEQGFYGLLETSRKETLNSIHQWNHTIIEAVNVIRKKLVQAEE
jgi:hypothetical protein